MAVPFSRPYRYGALTVTGSLAVSYRGLWIHGEQRACLTVPRKLLLSAR